MKKKKLILVCLDALSCTDLPIVEKLPHFAKMMNEGAYCVNEKSVYPSLTFPAHASIATGCVPASHGIVNNYVFNPFDAPPKWNFYAANLKKKAVWDYAKENGKRVLGMSWPVSAGADMAYSMPEMSPAKPKIWNAGSFLSQLNVLRTYGTPFFALKTFLSQRELPKAWFLGKQPQLDRCMMKSFIHALKTCDFDIALLHIYGLDDAKHVHGTAHPSIREYLESYDRFIGALMEYRKERADESVTLMITGDHSQKDVEYAVYANALMQKRGFADYKDKKPQSYRAWVDSCDGMAYVYISAPEKEQIRGAVKTCFQNHRGVSKVMEPAEFAPLGCDPKADLVLEAAAGYGFESGYDDEAFRTEDGVVTSHYRGLHGYLPDDKDFQTMFFCCGEDVAQVEIAEMGIIDILPTACLWLGMKTDAIDGVPKNQVWKQNP